MTINRIDALVSALETATGIAFARDAWEDKAPDEYGVVLYAGQTDALWADDVMEVQRHAVSIYAYVSGSRDSVLESVQDVLEDQDMTYRFEAREYLWDIDRVSWRWTAWIDGPVEIEVPDGTA